MITNQLKRNICAVLAAFAVTMAAVAQTDADTCGYRPVASVFMAGVGHTSSHDSYLSSVSYSGLNVGLAYEHLQATGFAPRRWTRQLSLSATFHNQRNPAANHKSYCVGLGAEWNMMHRWRDVFAPGLNFFAGAGTGIDDMVEYRPSNVNNVVSVHMRWDISAVAMAVYNTRIRRTPVSLRYQVTLPVIGVLYSPQYDESYYEMYVGNRSGLAHFASWGCRFDISNAVYADFRLGSTILRLGYRNRVYSSFLQNINSRLTVHSFVIGVGGELLTLGRESVTKSSVSTIY